MTIVNSAPFAWGWRVSGAAGGPTLLSARHAPSCTARHGVGHQWSIW